jgi:hypothetical protein
MQLDIQDEQHLGRSQKARATWDQSFQKMAKLSDDRLVNEASCAQTIWDDEEWEW